VLAPLPVPGLLSLARAATPTPAGGQASAEAEARQAVVKRVRVYDYFGAYFHAETGIELEPEYIFARPRKWPFDFAHVPSKVAVELEGGTFMKKGRHTTGVGFAKDCEKYNTAASMGWALFRLTPQMLDAEAQRWVEMIAATIRARS
jgi:hypothetical protein